MVGGEAGQIIKSPPERGSKCVGKSFRPWYSWRFCGMLDRTIIKDRSGRDGQPGNAIGLRHDQGRRRGEKWATEKVIKHYAPFIDELAVDEDMKQHLIMKLLEKLPDFPMEQA